MTFLEEIRMEFYKIASFKLVDIPLIEYASSKGKPIILSTGMGSLREIEDAVTAVALGASVIEKHFCLDREIDNPDASFSMNPNEFKQMVLDIRQAERAIGHVKYGISEQKTDSRIFRKSLFRTNCVTGY